MTASNHTYTVCSASPGKGIPHGSRCREMDTSWSPASISRTTSLRRIAGSTRNAPDPRHHSADVARLGRTDPIVITAEQPAPVVGERRGHPIHPFARGNVGPGGRLDDGLAMLVHPHEKMHLISPQPAIARDTVGA